MEHLPKLRDLMHEFVRQRHNPASVFQRQRLEFSESAVSAYPNSPTAKKYKKAYEIFHKAWSLLCQYSKAKVDTENDCDFLQQAFQGYAKAYMLDNIWYDKFKPPKIAFDLVDQYMQHRPNDMLSEYCKNIFVCRSHQCGSSEYSKFKDLQTCIRTYEVFAMKVKTIYSSSRIFNRKILATLYNHLGSLYTITEQRLRAIDSFQNSFDIDNDYHDSLFGIAYLQSFSNPDKSIILFHKYLDSAPKCDRKYYDAYYTLSLIFILVYENVTKCKEYYWKGKEAEQMQLPFVPPYDSASKLCLERLVDSIDKTRS